MALCDGCALGPSDGYRAPRPAERRIPKGAHYDRFGRNGAVRLRRTGMTKARSDETGWAYGPDHVDPLRDAYVAARTASHWMKPGAKEPPTSLQRSWPVATGMKAPRDERSVTNVWWSEEGRWCRHHMGVAEP